MPQAKTTEEEYRELVSKKAIVEKSNVIIQP
jgi:hypothetical protein